MRLAHVLLCYPCDIFFDMIAYLLYFYNNYFLYYYNFPFIHVVYDFQLGFDANIMTLEILLIVIWCFILLKFLIMLGSSLLNLLP